MKYKLDYAYCFSCCKHKKTTAMTTIGERGICNTCNERRQHWRAVARNTRQSQQELRHEAR